MYKNIQIYLSMLSLVFLISGCANIGYISEEYEEDFYRIPNRTDSIKTEGDSRFIVYSDNQGSWRFLEKFTNKKNWYTWKMAIMPFYQLYWLGNGIIGGFNWLRHLDHSGCHARTRVRDALIEEINNSNVDFVLNVGDIVASDGRRPKHWALFLNENRREKNLVDKIPYLPTVGNHERVGLSGPGKENFEEVFNYPQFYTVELEEAEIFVVNINLVIDWFDDIDDNYQEFAFEKWFVSSNPDEPAWLEQKLEESQKPFKIISIHISPVTFSKHYYDWHRPKTGINSREKQNRLLKLFEKNGVQLVFSGHDHLYQHNLLEYTNSENKQGEIHFIVTGGGGGLLRPVTQPEKKSLMIQDYIDHGFQVSSLKMITTHHYNIVEIKDHSLTIKVYSVPEKSSAKPELIDKIVIKTERHTPEKS